MRKLFLVLTAIALVLGLSSFATAQKMGQSKMKTQSMAKAKMPATHYECPSCKAMWSAKDAAKANYMCPYTKTKMVKTKGSMGMAAYECKMSKLAWSEAGAKKNKMLCPDCKMKMTRIYRPKISK